MDALMMDREQIINDEHLRLLSLGYYIAGGLNLAFSSLFIFHFVFFLVFASNPDMFPSSASGATGASDMGLHVFAWFIGIFILLGWLFGGLTIYAGRCIRSRSRRVFCLVMAALNTISIPVGTIVGVCGLIVLSRPGVRRLYGL